MMKKEALLLSLCLLMATPGGMVSMADAPAELEPAIMASAEPVEAENQKKRQTRRKDSLISRKGPMQLFIRKRQKKLLRCRKGIYIFPRIPR